MIEIDGSSKSGSGTIVRDAVGFSILRGEGLRLTNIRAKRDKPGLRPQHSGAVQAAARICRGDSFGASVGASGLDFEPGHRIRGGQYQFDIGTAGSATMLAMCLIPVGLFADSPSTYRITGGLFQDFAPSAFHMQNVLVSILARMGARIDVKILRPGYVPKGQGVLEVHIQPMEKYLKPWVCEERGEIESIGGISLASLLAARKVAQRMADECTKVLRSQSFSARVEIIDDTRDCPAFGQVAVQAGAALAIWARSENGCLLGADMAGALKRPAEYIGKRVARQLLEDLQQGAGVDRHLADQLIPFAALAEGTSIYQVPRITDHIESRLWLVEKMLGAKVKIDGRILRITGIGCRVG